MNIFEILGRHHSLFDSDLNNVQTTLLDEIKKSRFLVIGGAGSIGQAVTKELFKRNPKKLHVVDISENNMVELVRDVRSTAGYIDGDFRTFAIDCGAIEFEALMAVEGPYDYVFNLSALKHVRSEKDPYTLMRMLSVNILNTIKTFKLSHELGAKKYFCVSTDKAANPVSMMGASKRIMELFLMRESEKMPVSMARFANVAFSDGSLLHGFSQRLAKQQPIAAPKDVLRYFITPQESGELCLMSGIFGENREIFFPKLNSELNLTKFSDIAERYLKTQGYEPYYCDNEDDARNKCSELILKKQWPCYFFDSDTTGEKDYEEFFTGKERLDMQRYKGLGVINHQASYNSEKLDKFIIDIEMLKSKGRWEKQVLVDLFLSLVPEFAHMETGRYLDQKM